MIHALNIENKGVKLSDLVYLFDRADKKLHVAKMMIFRHKAWTKIKERKENK